MAGETLEVIPLPPAADSPTPAPDEQTADEIEDQMRVTQQSLAGKLGVLEEQTFGSVRDTIGAVNDAVSSVQSVVSDPIGAMQGAVHSAVMNPLENVTQDVTASVTSMVREFDPSAIVRDRPLESVGVAVIGGVVVGMILFGRPATGVGGKSGIFQGITDVLGGEVAKLGRELIGTVSRSVLERAKAAVSSPPGGKNYTV